MEKRNGAAPAGRSLPSSGGTEPMGDVFRPNLAMGGGGYRIPFDLPTGPGGFSPKLELSYSTGGGNGHFGLGWSLALPSIQRERAKPFAPADAPRYTLAGAEELVPLNAAGDFVPRIQPKLQVFHFDGSEWSSRLPDLSTLHFGRSDNSRVSNTVDGALQVRSWLLDRMSFPGDRHVELSYLAEGTERYLDRIRWSVFTLQFHWQARPDPFSRFSSGAEVATEKRCIRITLHHEGLAPETLIRSWDLAYERSTLSGASLLTRLHVQGWRMMNGALRAFPLPALTFGYTTADPTRARIRKFTSSVTPPPGLGEDSTLLDLRGTALPGVLRMNGDEATYWENIGGLRWGPPRALRPGPAGVRLSDGQVLFADITGNGTSDLVIAEAGGGRYHANDPERGLLARTSLPLAPGFDLSADDVWLTDLDGDRVADLLTFRNGRPMAFFNKDGRAWEGPVVLPDGPLSGLEVRQPDMRLADMTGNGSSDLVVMTSRRITYYPFLGNGRWGEARVMAETPAFDMRDASSGTYLVDVNGDGAADLVLVRGTQVRIHFNRAGRGFSEAFVWDRTPSMAAQRLLMADMNGTGSTGLLWTASTASGAPNTYWYLDVLDGVKEGLLARIDNGRGLVTTMDYSTSAHERSLDLNEGRTWTGYLPFVVHVVKRVTTTDAFSGTPPQVVEYRYHDGHYDGNAREYLGFGMVTSRRQATAYEAELLQRSWFHNGIGQGGDPAFVASKGQPYRLETLDPSTGEVCQEEGSEWRAEPVPTADPQRPAWLVNTAQRSNRRQQNGVVYAEERIAFTTDAIGNTLREDRTATWTDIDGNTRTDALRIENCYAVHAVHGLTDRPSLMMKSDPSTGAMLKHMSYHYDGAPFIGLPQGEVVNGFLSRQTEIALTSAQVAAAYGGSDTDLLPHYRKEHHPDLGDVYVHDTRRYHNDHWGNQLATIDAVGAEMTYVYGADHIHPVRYTQNGSAPMRLEFDPVSQQVTVMQDLNGHLVRTELDPFGNPLRVFRRGDPDDRPTEEFTYDHEHLPGSITRRIRINATDTVPGAVRIRYQDGSGRTCQEKNLTETGDYAVAKQAVYGAQGKVVLDRAAWRSASAAFEATPDDVPAQHTWYDHGARPVRQQLFNGSMLCYAYVGNENRFYDHRWSAAFMADATTPAPKSSWTDAWGRTVALTEREGTVVHRETRRFDALDQLLEVTDPLGHTVLHSTYDLWGNRIAIRSAEAGESRYVFDANNQHVLTTDADGRTVAFERDLRGRTVRVREGGLTGTVLESFTYGTDATANLNGRLARVDGPSWNVRYTYNAEGKPVRIEWHYDERPAPFTVELGYNLQQEVDRVRYPDGNEVAYDHHATGLLGRIPGFIEAIDHDANGERVRTVFANGIETLRTLSPGDGLLTELLTRSADGNTRFQHLRYTLDPIGQVTQIDDLANVAGKVRNDRTYSYDERFRLVRATGRSALGDYDLHYAYDALGNLVRSGEGLNEAMDHGHGTGDTAHPNRVVKRRSAATAEYTYDASGNLLHDPEVGQLRYDARHRLVRVDRKDGAVITYDLDHEGRKIRTTLKHNGNVSVRYEVEGLFVQEGTRTTRVVRDGDRKLAIVPGTGDTLLHHLDRLGNVNIVTNLNTGTFVGQDEYTPYGQLSISVVIEPHYSFQGAEFADGLDIVLLGARVYRPRLGRFLSPDRYLIEQQEKIPALLGALNMYSYVYGNPVNGTDPTGNIAFLVILAIAVVVGMVAGAIGAAVNGAATWDQWVVWILGGAVGGALVALGAFGIALWITGCAAYATTAAIVAVSIWGATALIGSWATKLLDDSNSPVAWFFSFLIKWIQSPVLTTIGLVVTLFAALGGSKVDLRRGMLFVEVSGGGALTLGAIAWTGSNEWQGGQVPDALARHEAVHSRTVASIGELGFYVTYLLVGAPWGIAQGGAWNDLNGAGCGNPFEKIAHTFHSPHAPFGQAGIPQATC